jgi:hypothetical protein
MKDTVKVSIYPPIIAVQIEGIPDVGRVTFGEKKDVVKRCDLLRFKKNVFEEATLLRVDGCPAMRSFYFGQVINLIRKDIAPLMTRYDCLLDLEGEPWNGYTPWAEGASYYEKKKKDPSHYLYRRWEDGCGRGEVMKHKGETKITQTGNFYLLTSHSIYIKGSSMGEKLVENGVTFDGLIWRICDKNGRHPDLEGCEITNCHIEGSDLSKINFKGSNFKGTVFKDCDLTGSNFECAQMEGCSFINCSMLRLDFDGASLSGSQYENCDM